MSRVKNALGGLAILASSILATGCSNDFKPSVYTESAFVSDYTNTHGPAVRGAQRQDFVKASFGNGLSANMWQNYSEAEGDFSERDFGGMYSIPITENLSARVGMGYWTHPSGSFGKVNNWVVKAGAHYSGDVDLDFDVTNIIHDREVDKGTRYVFEASKTFAVYDSLNKKLAVKLTPKVNTSITDNYYGRSDVFPQVTIGAELGVKKKFKDFNVGAGLFVNHQIGNAPDIDTFTWSGFKLTFDF